MSESTYQNFLRWISGEESGWHEISVEIAAEILATFSMEDWQHLCSQALQQPSYWQERCAEAIGKSSAENGVPILISLLNADCLTVSCIAASELSNLEVSIPSTYEARLRHLAAHLRERNSPRYEDVQRLLSTLLAK